MTTQKKDMARIEGPSPKIQKTVSQSRAATSLTDLLRRIDQQPAQVQELIRRRVTGPPLNPIERAWRDVSANVPRARHRPPKGVDGRGLIREIRNDPHDKFSRVMAMMMAKGVFEQANKLDQALIVLHKELRKIETPVERWRRCLKESQDALHPSTRRGKCKRLLEDEKLKIEHSVLLQTLKSSLQCHPEDRRLVATIFQKEVAAVLNGKSCYKNTKSRLFKEKYFRQSRFCQRRFDPVSAPTTMWTPTTLVHYLSDYRSALRHSHHVSESAVGGDNSVT